MLVLPVCNSLSQSCHANRLLQRVLAVGVKVDDDAPLLVERDPTRTDNGGGDDRVLDGGQTVVVKVLGLGFALVDLDTVVSSPGQQQDNVWATLPGTHQASTQLLKLTYPYPLCPSKEPSGAGEYFM